MKHIGIVDITTVGACICANAIVAKAAETVGNAHPEFTMHAFPFERYWQAIDEKDCDAVILGCTELPEVFNQNNLGMPAIDTTRLLAYKALEYSIKTNEGSS